MIKVETAHGLLGMDEPTFGMNVYEDETGFCTRLVIDTGGVRHGLVIHHGPNEDYSGKIPPLYVPSPEGENPVGLMLQMSEEHRHDLHWWKRAQEMREASTLIQDVIKQEEEDRLRVRNLSTFGPYQRTARGGYSHETTLRNWWTERARVTKKTKSFDKQRIRP